MPPKPDIWHAECNMMSTYALQPCNIIYPTFIEVVKSYSKVKIAPAMGRHRIKKKEKDTMLWVQRRARNTQYIDDIIFMFIMVPNPPVGESC